MAHHKSHRVRTHKWKDGVLHHQDGFFSDLESAMQYIESMDFDSYKVYDEDDLLVRSGGDQRCELYA